jgi:hypothetical protein
MEVEKMGTMELRLQSSGADVSTPSSLLSGSLKMDHAYTDPMLMCKARDAGGMSHLLNPSFATMFSFSRNLGSLREEKKPFFSGFTCGSDSFSGREEKRAWGLK